MSEVFRIQALYCGVNKEFIDNSECLTLNEKGVLEDYHNDNRILMLDLDTYNHMHEESALCMKSFYANIVYKNLKNIQLSIGDKLHKNELLLNITHIGKRCHSSDGCNYLSNHANCPLKDNTIYLECLNPGIVKVNDQWEVTKCIDTQ